MKYFLSTTWIFFPWKRHLADFVHPHLTVVKYLIIIFCQVSELFSPLVFVKTKNRIMHIIYGQKMEISRHFTFHLPLYSRNSFLTPKVWFIHISKMTDNHSNQMIKRAHLTPLFSNYFVCYFPHIVCISIFSICWWKLGKAQRNKGIFSWY